MTGTTIPTRPTYRAPRAEMSDEAVGLALILITLLAMILRVFSLGSQSLWVDELLTIDQGRLGDSLWGQFLDDYQSPLPMVVIAALARVSLAEAWLRLPGALLGTLSVPLLFELGRRLGGARLGLVAALLLAVHPFHVFHSQELRGYAYMIFFGLAATVVATGAGGRLSWSRAGAVVVLGVATSLSNLQGLFWMGSLGLALVASGRVDRRDLGRWALVFGLILVLMMPWWGGAADTHEPGRLAPGAETGSPLRGESTFSPWALPYGGFVLAMGNTVGPTPREIHERALSASGPGLPRRHWPAAVGVAGLTLALVVAGLGALGRKGVVVILWGALPIAAALLLAARNVKPFNPRYIIASLPALVLILAAGLTSLPRRAGFLILVAWLAFSGLALYRYYFDPWYGREDVRGAVRLIESREGPDDLILVPTVGNVFRFYYRGTNPIALHHGEHWSTREAIAGRIDNLHPDRRFLWYVRARPWHDDPEGRLLDVLQGSYPRVALFPLAGVEVLLFDRDGVVTPGSEPQGGDLTRPEGG